MSGEPVISPEISADGRLKAKGQLEIGLRSCAFLPLRVGGIVRGIIHLASRTTGFFTPEKESHLSAIAHAMAVALENRELLENTERRAREQEALNSIATAISQSLDIEEFFDIALQKILEVTGRERASVRMKDALTGRIIICAHRGFSEEEVEALRRRTSHAASEQVFVSGKPVVVNESAKHSSSHSLLAASRSVAWIPIKSRANVVGVLGISATQAMPFSTREVSFLEAVGAVIGVALENVRLYENERRQVESLRLLVSASRKLIEQVDVDAVGHDILKTLVTSFGVRLAWIGSAEADGRVRPLYREGDAEYLRDVEIRWDDSPLGQGPAGIAIRTGRPIVMDVAADSRFAPWREAAVAKGYRQVAAFPMMRGTTSFGQLIVYSDRPGFFTTAKVELIQTYANIATGAFEKARLFQETQRSLDRIRALHEIDKAITGTLDLKTMLDVLLEKIELSLPYRGAYTIRLWNKESGLLEPVACRNLDFETWTKWKRARGTANIVYETAAPVMIRNVQSDPRTLDREFFVRNNLASYLGIPLMVKGQVLGVLGFYFAEEHWFSDEEVELLLTLAGQGAIAIQNSQLYQEAQRREAQVQETNRLLSALHSVTEAAANQSLTIDQVLQEAIEKITGIFRFDATRIDLYNDTGDELRLRAAFETKADGFTSTTTVFKKGRGIIGTVAECGNARIFDDVLTDQEYWHTSTSKAVAKFGYRFFAVFPIRSKVRAFGTLTCVGFASRKLNSGEIQVLEAIADRTGVAIENRDLYEQLKQKLDELQQSTEELAKANKVKDEFLGVMSHELRTPLNVVIGYTTMMRDKLLGDISAEQEKALGKVLNRAEDQLRLINNILYATSLEADAIQLQKDPVDLREFLEDLKSGYSTLDKPDLFLEWDYSLGIPAITTDSFKLKQILQNLIDNALKFTPRGFVRVSVSYLPEKDEFKFAVEDTGIGIRPELLPIIFDKFRQADSSDTRLYEGVGLGLYIVEQLTRVLGGRIEVQSKPQKGTTFWVTLQRVPRGGDSPSSQTSLSTAGCDP
jgi:GAF domain-containing protein